MVVCHVPVLWDASLSRAVMSLIVDQSEASIKAVDQWEGSYRSVRGRRDVSRFMWGNYQSLTQTIPRLLRLTTLGTKLASHWLDPEIKGSYWSLTCLVFIKLCGAQKWIFRMIDDNQEAEKRGEMCFWLVECWMSFKTFWPWYWRLVNGLKLLTFKLVADA